MQTIKTVFFLGLLTGLFLALGLLVGGTQGMIIAFILSVGTNIYAYYFSGTMALKMYNAIEIFSHNSPEIHLIVEELSRNAGIPKPKIYLAQMGVPNAFATGRNPENAAIAVTPEIVDILNYEELRGVLAHEIAHIKNRDILLSSIAAVLGGAISMLGNMMMFGGNNNRGNLLASLIVMIVSPMAAMLVQTAISRSREYMADDLGGRLSGSPIGLADALLKLENASSRRQYDSDVNPATAHMMIVNPLRGGALQSLFSTHPLTAERVTRLHALAKYMGQR